MLSLCAMQCHLGQLEAHFQPSFSLTGQACSVPSGLLLWLASQHPGLMLPLLRAWWSQSSCISHTEQLPRGGM